MTEQTGAGDGKVQLHLRVSPEVAGLLDACRGAATRPAYAAMVLERELRQQSAAFAPKAPVDLSVPGIPGLSDAEVDGFLGAVSEGGEPAERPAPKRAARKDTGPGKVPHRCPVKGWCGVCQEQKGGGKW